ncbi:MAG: 2-oxo acid dehydrogenase subunit E2, partial [Dehalococcoidia bacterium]|nr:2-oxo acid dehydrogenase subunit E2 [Dehalococcoidia bacterium]
MAIEVVMPQMGADMTEGTLVRWLKNPGDSVARGDIIAEIETDKATVELEAFEAGVLRQVVASEGDVVPVGEVIALLGDADEEMPEVERRAPSEKPTPRAVAAPTADGTGGDLDARRVRVSPVARRIADDAGIDLAEVTGSGPDGRILRRDVE